MKSGWSEVSGKKRQPTSYFLGAGCDQEEECQGHAKTPTVPKWKVPDPTIFFGEGWLRTETHEFLMHYHGERNPRPRKPVDHPGQISCW
jgi:hypothetical protein